MQGHIKRAHRDEVYVHIQKHVMPREERNIQRVKYIVTALYGDER